MPCYYTIQFLKCQGKVFSFSYVEKGFCIFHISTFLIHLIKLYPISPKSLSSLSPVPFSLLFLASFFFKDPLFHKIRCSFPHVIHILWKTYVNL